ncbi:MAG: LysM peptidoglycan-binding domain-containing protein [Chloroflexota bacterium]
MNRRQLAFVLIINALLSFAIALTVVWITELRRPDTEELLSIALLTPAPGYQTNPQVGQQPGSAAAPIINDANLPNAENGSGVAEGSEAGTELTSDSVQPTVLEEPTGTPVPTPATIASDSGAQSIYVVQAGDSLGAIATRFGITLDELISVNGLTDPNFVFSGQRLVIPVRDSSANDTTAGDNGSESTARTARSAPSVTDGDPGVQISLVNSPGELAEEAVLLVNESNRPINLQGWQLVRRLSADSAQSDSAQSDSEELAYTFSNLPLFAGSSVRLLSDTGIDNSVALYWSRSEAIWQSGSIVLLQDQNGNEIDRYIIE